MLEEINLARIRRILMGDTGTQELLERIAHGSHRSHGFFEKRGRNDEMKRIFRRECFLKKEGNFRGEKEKEGIFEGKPMEFLCTKMNIYAKQEEGMNKHPKQRL